MIRIVFTATPPGPWAHEMLVNQRITSVLKEHGVPVAARLAFSGVERGTLEVTHIAERSVLICIYAVEGESREPQTWRKTHTGKGYTVHLSGEHLAKHEEDEEL